MGSALLEFLLIRTDLFVELFNILRQLGHSGEETAVGARGRGGRVVGRHDE